MRNVFLICLALVVSADLGASEMAPADSAAPVTVTILDSQQEPALALDWAFVEAPSTAAAEASLEIDGFEDAAFGSCFQNAICVLDEHCGIGGCCIRNQCDCH